MKQKNTENKENLVFRNKITLVSVVTLTKAGFRTNSWLQTDSLVIL